MSEEAEILRRSRRWLWRQIKTKQGAPICSSSTRRRVTCKKGAIKRPFLSQLNLSDCHNLNAVAADTVFLPGLSGDTISIGGEVPVMTSGRCRRFWCEDGQEE